MNKIKSLGEEGGKLIVDHVTTFVAGFFVAYYIGTFLA